MKKVENPDIRVDACFVAYRTSGEVCLPDLKFNDEEDAGDGLHIRGENGVARDRQDMTVRRLSQKRTHVREFRRHGVPAETRVRLASLRSAGQIAGCRQLPSLQCGCCPGTL